MNATPSGRRDRDLFEKNGSETSEPVNPGKRLAIVTQESNVAPVASSNGSKPPTIGDKPTASMEAPDPWDLSRLKIRQDFATLAGVRRILTTVPVRKPDKTWFVQTHPEHRLETPVIELKQENETYLVASKLWEELSTETAFSPRLLVLSISRLGNLFVWPVKLPGPDGKVDTWSQSALQAVQLAQTEWVRVTANINLGAYDVFVAEGELPPPKWPTMSFQEIIKIGFRGKMIDSMDHPVLQRLRGEI
jgi:hypothetical protein